jgi:SAM-dependent methyltransferase
MLRRGAWHRRDVARGHVAAAVEALRQDPADVPPFRIFLAALGATVERLPKRTRLLDVGCGGGQYGVLLDRVYPGRFEYVGADLPAMIAEARHAFPQLTLIVADLERGEPPLDGYDVVLASGVITVLRHWRRALERLLACPAPLVILHRQVLGAETTLSRELAYGRKGRCVTIGRPELARLVLASGRSIEEFDDPDWRESALLLWRTKSRRTVA